VACGDEECFLLRSRLPDGRTRLRYIHRGNEGWVLLAEDPAGAEIEVGERATILRLPLHGPTAPFRWEYELAGTQFDVQIVCSEAIQVAAGSFPNAHRVKEWRMDDSGCGCHSGARSETFWFAAGVGLVKWVTGEGSYELVASSYLAEAPPRLLEWSDRGSGVELSPGQTAVLQLPTVWDGTYRWRASSEDPGVVTVGEPGRYADLHPGLDGRQCGSYVVDLSVPADGISGASATVWVRFAPLEPETVPAYTFEIDVTVR
jgi:hypothetical protein